MRRAATEAYDGRDNEDGYSRVGVIRIGCNGDDTGEVNANGSCSSIRDDRSSVVIIDRLLIDRPEDQRLGVVIASSFKILLCLGDDSIEGEDLLLVDLISLLASRVTMASSDD